MKILNQKLSINEFKSYIQNKNFGSIPPTWLVIHHTWKPTKNEWKGEKTISGLKTYYESKGWSAGPHLFIAEDGIWLFTDMNEIGIHADKGNGRWQNKTTGKIFGGYTTSSDYKLLGYSIGIEVVGDYDNEVWSGNTYKNTIEAIKILINQLNISKNEIYFHRDYSTKTCPGKAITKEWLFKEIEKTTNNNENEKPETNNDNNLEIKKLLQVVDFWKKEDPIYINNDQENYNFDAQYKIKNISNKTINLDEIALALHDSNDKFISDLYYPEQNKPRIYKNISLLPNERFHFIWSVFKIQKTGNYLIVAKIKYKNKWYNLESLNFQVKELEYDRFNDKESIQRMKEILINLENKLNNNFGNKLTNSDKNKIINWIKSK